MKKIKTFAAALALTTIASAAGAVDLQFSGYMRAGTGINARGGTQVCFGVPGADTKWRLGNECDYTIEPNFSSKMTEFDGSSWFVHFMPSVYRAWGQEENGTNELTARFGQAYVHGDGIRQLLNGSLWAGRRFYNRLQTGINDQFLENNDGDGAGLENMDLGFGKLSVAVMLNGREAANDNRLALPVRLTGIKTLASGELSIYATGYHSLQSEDQTTGIEPADRANGGALGLYQTLNGTFGGSTLFGLKFDKNIGGGVTRNGRFVIQQSGSIASLKTSWDLLGEYRKNETAGIGNRWVALGGRTDTHLGGPFRMLFELGNDNVKIDGERARNMTKFTAALAVSAGQDAGSRPTLRFFVTTARWNDATKAVLGQNWVNGERLQRVYGDKNAGTSLGIQAETWW